MAQIDIKEATIKIFDGTLGTTTVDFTAAEADMVFTAKSRHIGSDKISITFVDPAAPSASLSVVVTGRDIVVNLATSTASAITTTAALAKTAIEASVAANALVTVAFDTGEDGSGLLNAKPKVTLDGQQSITVKIGEGTLTYSEKRPVEFTRDRGILDTVRLADEEPMDLSLDATWEYITSETGGTPTLEDVLKQIGEAATWLSTADDQCQPYCVDVELWNAPQCSGTDDEITMFEEYYWETLDHALRDGTIATSGRCNRKTASSRRVASADIA